MDKNNSGRHWLFKTEPSAFSWDDLKNSPAQTTHWDGVRNYQARNFMKSMKKGDLIFFYHSVVQPQAICGVCEVSKEFYPDHTQFDPQSKYFDPKATMENPRWFMVDVVYKKEFSPFITREELKQTEGLEDMVLLQKGSRLSIQPVSAREWSTIVSLRSR